VSRAEADRPPTGGVDAYLARVAHDVNLAAAEQDDDAGRTFLRTVDEPGASGPAG